MVCTWKTCVDSKRVQEECLLSVFFFFFFTTYTQEFALFKGIYLRHFKQNPVKKFTDDSA